VRSGRWSEREAELPGDVDGGVIGIVGLGRIGSRVAEIATALGMRLLAHDPYVGDVEVAGTGTQLVGFEELLSRADVVTLHAPLTAETRRLVSGPALAITRPGLILVNSSRGALVDLDAAYEALCSGVLAGLGLDVYDPEPPDVSHPVYGHPHVVLTPHVLGLSRLAWRKTFEDVAESIAEVIGGRRAPAIANPELYR
ncbi:MAG TPA: NAD(P)-dependent oxidoreductase, partial [Acidimicrobiales bacterium]|nr:NAD(P)-dependent oxidoreductase [Acidimicrobiales bacterium]